MTSLAAGQMMNSQIPEDGLKRRLEADNKAHNKNIDNSVKKCLQIINTIDRNAFMVINETKYVVNGFFK